MQIMVRALQDGGDIVTSGEHFKKDRQAIAQTIKTRLSLFYGEYFRDITEGTPWYQVILVKNTTLQTKEAALKEIITTSPGVEKLLKFETDFELEDRRYTVRCVVLSEFGVIELEQVGAI